MSLNAQFYMYLAAGAAAGYFAAPKLAKVNPLAGAAVGAFATWYWLKQKEQFGLETQAAFAAAASGKK